MNRIYNVRSLKQNEQSYNVPSKSLSEPRWKLLRLLSTSEATQTEYSEKNCIYSRCTMWSSHKCHSCYSLEWFFATPWIAACQASLFFTKSQSLLKLMSIGPMMLSNHLIHCYLLFLLLSIFPRIRVFSNESALASGSQSTGASALVSVIPRNIQIWFPLGLIFFNLLAAQGTFKSLLQHHISNASVLQHTILFMVQLSHLYKTTGKTIALTLWTFVGKVISLIFNTLSTFVTAFLPRSKCLLIFWLLSPLTVILNPPKIKSISVTILLIYFP